MTRAEVIQNLPVFPLPGTVFFPGTLLPLHVFEPRYRQLTEAVLKGDGVMAIALIRGTGPRGQEEIHPVAGLGRVVHHDRLPDGRYHLLLQGTGRVILGEESPPQGLLYRRFLASMRHDLTSECEQTLHHECKTLRACYGELLSVCPDMRDALGDLPTRVKDPAALADIVCATAIENCKRRQEALAERSVVGRVRMASDALAEILLANVSGSGSCVH